MESTVVRSSMHLMRVHNWRSVVDHRSRMNKSGHSRLWIRCPQVDNFNRVSSFCNGFLNNSFDNSPFDSLLYSSSWDRLSCNMNTDRQLTAKDGRVMVRGVHRVVDHRCVMDHRGVHSMVDHRGSMVDYR